MPINPDALEEANPGDSPQLADFKKKLVRVVNQAVSNYGYDAAAREALTELGLKNTAEGLALVADMDVSFKVTLNGFTVDDLKNKTADEVNTLIAERIGSGFVVYADSVAFQRGRLDRRAYQIAVRDVNLATP